MRQGSRTCDQINRSSQAQDSCMVEGVAMVAGEKSSEDGERISPLMYVGGQHGFF